MTGSSELEKSFREDCLHIQLQRVDRQGRNHVQGGVSGAEIVHFNPEAQVPQAGNHLDDLLRVLGVGGFGDLQVQVAEVDPIPPDLTSNAFSSSSAVP